MTYRIPDLPRDKTHHIFVCYENNSLDVVQTIVDNLEKEGITCIYFERDFIPGRHILENIEDAIRKSSYMLIVLSEEFENSKFCKYELKEALHLKVEEKYSLIPIKIEPCSVPEYLRHHVFINVEGNIETAHAKIRDAINKQEILADSKRETNGESKQFKLKPYKPSSLSFERYRLKFEESETAELWNNQYEVSAETLQEIENTVNESLLMKYQQMWDHPFVSIFAIFLNLLLLLTIFFLILFITTSGKEKAESFPPTGYALLICLPLWLLSFFFSVLVHVFHEGNYGVYWKVCRRLNTELWDISKQNNSETGLIYFLQDGYPKQRRFWIMRYNFKLCKVHFARNIVKKDYLQKFRRQAETNEECTSRLFDEFLSHNCEKLRFSFPSNEQRHPMKNNAKCVCLLVETWLRT